MPTTPAATTTRVPLPPSVVDAFPTRPVVVRAGGLPIAVALWLLTFVAAAVAIVVLSWRGLAPDYAMGDDVSVVPLAAVEGSCTTRGRIFSSCDVTMTYLADGEVREVDRSYFWVELEEAGGYSDVLVSRDGEHATLGLAQDRLTNRTLTSVAFLLMCLWLVKLCADHVRRLLRLRRTYGAEGGLELVPVPAYVRKVTGKSHLQGPTLHFGADVDGRLHRSVHGLPGVGSALRTASGVYVAVAPASGAGEPVLLDADLTGLELAEEERAALLAAVASS